jgi:hypothetical protein
MDYCHFNLVSYHVLQLGSPYSENTKPETTNLGIGIRICYVVGSMHSIIRSLEGGEKMAFYSRVPPVCKTFQFSSLNSKMRKQSVLDLVRVHDWNLNG